MSESSSEEQKRWQLTAIGTVVSLVGFGLVLAVLVEPRVFSLTGKPPGFIVREDITGDSVGTAIQLGFLTLAGLWGVLWGARKITGSKDRSSAMWAWLFGMLAVGVGLYFGRDAITVSELRVWTDERRVSCGGYVLGRKRWGSSALYSEIATVDFPVGAGARRGVLIKSGQGEFCSLHNRTLDSSEAKQLGQALGKELGASKVRGPLGARPERRPLAHFLRRSLA